MASSYGAQGAISGRRAAPRAAFIGSMPESAAQSEAPAQTAEQDEDNADADLGIVTGGLGPDAFHGDNEQDEDDDGGERMGLREDGAESLPRRYTSRLRRPGAEYTIWRGSAGSQQRDARVPESTERRFRRRDSRVLSACRTRSCFLTKDESTWRRLQPGTQRASLEEEMQPYKDLLDGFAEARFFNDLIAIENFILLVDPDSALGQYITYMGDIGALDPDNEDDWRRIEESRFKEPVPIPLEVLQHLMRSCAEDAEKDLDFTNHKNEVVKVRGQGLGYPSIHGYWCAVARYHALLGIPEKSPTRIAVAIDRMKQLRAAHRTEHTSALDLLEDLPFIRQAIFDAPNQSWSNCPAKKAHHWALILYLIDHAHRCVCVCVCVCV